MSITHSPFFNFEVIALAGSDSFPFWISMLELSLRGDLGLLGLQRLCKVDCSGPTQSCKHICSTGEVCLILTEN